MHVHNIDLILTLTRGLTAALRLGYVPPRLALAPLVGYPIDGTLLRRERRGVHRKLFGNPGK